jgi:acyl-coenzyme A thioesterase PaaI-like protein
MPAPFVRLMEWIGPRRALRLMALYPPYLGAGVAVEDVDLAAARITVAMPLRPWTRNAVGTHFGGSLYSMCDPWFMLLMMIRLGDDFVVWDKSAAIDFRRPGRGRVRATFLLDADTVERVRGEALATGRCRPVLRADVVDDDGELIAQVTKTLSVRPRAPRGPVPQTA